MSDSRIDSLIQAMQAHRADMRTGFRDTGRISGFQEAIEFVREFSDMSTKPDKLSTSEKCVKEIPDREQNAEKRQKEGENSRSGISEALNDCREAFEQWVSTSGDAHWHELVQRDAKGNYTNSVIKGGWFVWLKLWPQIQQQREIPILSDEEIKEIESQFTNERMHIAGRWWVPVEYETANPCEIPVISEEMKIAGGRSIGASMRWPNHTERAADCFQTMLEVRMGIMPLIPEAKPKRESGYLCDKHQRGSNVEGAECSECYRERVSKISPPQTWTVYDLNDPKGYRTFYSEAEATAYSEKITKIEGQPS